MTSIRVPGWDRAVPDVRVRCGARTNCGGVAAAVVDVEPHDVFAFVRRLDPGGPGDRELVDLCAGWFEEGIRAQLLDVCGGTLPPVRVVLRRILVHEVDSNERRNRQAGRLAVTEAVRRATAGGHATPATIGDHVTAVTAGGHATPATAGDHAAPTIAGDQRRTV
jgi:hypothetical protein